MKIGARARLLTEEFIHEGWTDREYSSMQESIADEIRAAVHAERKLWEELVSAKDALLRCYRTQTGRGAGKALDRIVRATKALGLDR